MRTFLRSSTEDWSGEAAIRECRVELAQRNSHWSELQETDLVRRGRLLVHAQSDQVFSFYRGLVFDPSFASISFNETVPMWFYVDRAGEVVFLERKSWTWTERLEKRAELGRRRNAPAPPRKWMEPKA